MGPLRAEVIRPLVLCSPAPNLTARFAQGAKVAKKIGSSFAVQGLGLASCQVLEGGEQVSKPVTCNPTPDTYFTM